MRVTANVLLNYIRCRRYASLNDPSSDSYGIGYDIHTKNYYQDYLDIFLLNYKDDFNDITRNYTLSYDFHNDITLFETYHFNMKQDTTNELYCLIPSTSKEFLKLRYACEGHKYQLFHKNKQGIYELDQNKCSSIESNYDERISKLTKRSEDIGRIVYNYAFKQFLYNTIYPNNTSKLYVVLLNSDYIYDGVAYTKNMFHIMDFSNVYKYFKEIIKADIYRMINHIELNDFTPCELVKKECRKGDSFECKFTNFCFSHVPKHNSILDYFSSHLGFDEPTEEGDIHHSTYELLNNGDVDLLDIPISWLKDEKHLMQRYCSETDYVHVHKEKIEMLLKTLKYPLIYLDFEAVPCLIPRYFGETPYTQSVFQYSIHIEHIEGKLKFDDKNHFEFIANPGYDNRRELVKNMITLINKYNSSVIVYHKTYEQQRLKEFQSIFPEYKAELQRIIDRLFDLKDVLKNSKRFYKEHGLSEFEANRYNFYSSKLSGSYSLKKVIRVFNEEAYKDLAIKDGEQAYKAYMNLEKLDPTEQDNVIQNLLEYCKQDTYSMFEIIHGLKQYLTPGFQIT